MAETAGRRQPEAGADRDRTVAQLDMLHSLGAKLNALGDVEEIGTAITSELRSILAYHNCRVYLLQPDGETLLPIAFQGELFTEYEEETMDQLVSKVGEGITGNVAATRRSLLTPDARQVPFSVTIAGTDDDLLESMLAVPMLAGGEVVGVIVLSSLGYGMFDEIDQRMLEVLASHAGVAFQNANLLATAREAARASGTLLQLSQTLTSKRNIGDIFQAAIETIPSIVASRAAAAYVHDPETAGFKAARVHAVAGVRLRPRASIADVPAEVANAFLTGSDQPFVITREIALQVPAELWIVDEVSDVLVTPLRWDPDGFGAIIVIGELTGSGFGERDIRVSRGIADITSLALGNARRLSELERFHELVASLDAIFWESTTDLSFTFVGGRSEPILGSDAGLWPLHGRTWGQHIAAEDRDIMVRSIERAIRDGEDVTLEYRVVAPNAGEVWIRDLIHVVRGTQRPRQLRGLMVDITQRKLAEQALRASERQASDAFRREREAAKRLRALDEMKNTFLEAVSHDLRTPLTSILGSALTLEQTQLDIPREDAIDLVRRIATNARKLERLLGDLLDLDRLQRGIISPQRRATNLQELVSRAVEETENPHGRDVHLEVAPVAASVDGAKVERIIENLVSNALRHTPHDANVWVRADGRDGGVVLVVEDDGPGIPDDLKEEIFEPFRQAPGSAAGHSPGVGVGLSLVRRFAELHGGRAWVEDRAGGGASFRVFLPGG
jgi:signal transduction histidine kinase/putative methionine-R-sulfoxide reductase with GAF domain